MVMRGGVWPVGLPELEARGADPEDRAILRVVTPEYFRVLGIPLLQGRGIAASDGGTTRLVAVVSESFAKRYWPNGDALGRTFTFAFFERTLVGVVGDVRFAESSSSPNRRCISRTARCPMAACPFTRRRTWW